MSNQRKMSKRAASAVLAVLCLGPQAAMVPAVATTISGVTGNNGVYNINPTDKISNTDIGYRKYNNFNLSKGDIANLIFKYGADNIDTFINLVDNTIRIDGIVNSMRDGNFYNGRAIFVSPNGMIVGASGVLNVGSLGVYTPNNSVYKKYKENPNSDLSALQDKNNVGNGAVQINGKVYAANDVDVTSSRVHVNGKVAAGLGNNAIYDGTKAAEVLFDNLVNTADMHKANGIASKDGNITFTSTIGTAIKGDVVNYGNGDININNSGAAGTYVSGKLENLHGNMNINNSQGSIYFAKGGRVANNGGTMSLVNTGKGIYIVKGANVENNGNLKMSNTGANGTVIGGDVKNTGNAEIDNRAGALSVAGSFTNKGDTKLTNSGTQLNISGTVNNDGRLTLNNSGAEGLKVLKTASVNSKGLDVTNSGAGGMDINGKVVNEGAANFNNRNGRLGVGGTVENSKGILDFENTGKGGLYVYEDAKITSDNSNKDSLDMNNFGEGGLNIYGTVDTKGNANFTNADTGTKGLNIAGKVTTTNGNSTFTNYGEGGLNINGVVRNTAGKTTITNNGEKGLNIKKDGTVIADNVDIINNGKEGLNIKGKVMVGENGNIVNNEGGEYGLNIDGTVSRGTSDRETSQGTLTIENHGRNGLNIKETGTVSSTRNGKTNLVLKNSGYKGLNIGGTLINSGDTYILNEEGGRNGINVRGTVTNTNGNLTMKSDGYIGLNVRETGVVNAEGLTMENSGANGLNIKGKVNNKGNATLTSTNGDIRLFEGGEFTNKGGNVNMNNSGANGTVLFGKYDNEGNTTIENNNGALSIGGTFTNKGNTTLTNNGSQLNISGTVTNTDGQLKMTNTGKDGIHIIKSGTVNAEGLEITNSGVGGYTQTGTINNNGNAKITNTAAGKNGMKIAGDITNTNGTLNVTNNAGNMIVYTTSDINASNADNKDALKMTNNSDGDMNIRGNVKTNGNAAYENSGKGGMKIIGNTETKNGNATLVNNGAKGVQVWGNVTADGDVNITNTGAGGMNFYSTTNGSVSGKNVNIANKGGNGLYVYNKIEGKDSVNLYNKGENGLYVDGKATINQGGAQNPETNSVTLSNEGDKGIIFAGNVDADGNVVFNNTGKEGTYVAPKAKVTSDGNVYLNDNSKKGIRQRGEVSAKGQVVKSEKVNITEPDTPVVNTDDKTVVTRKFDSTVVADKDLVINNAAIQNMSLGSLKANDKIIMDVDDEN